MQFLLQRLGVGVAANRDVAREKRLLAAHRVDVDGAGADVEQDDDGAGLDAVVRFVGVLQREGVDIDDDRRAAGLGDDAGVVGDLLLLRRDQQHFHAGAGRGCRRRALAALRALAVRGAAQDLVVEIDVLNVERDVLPGLPVDGVGQFGLRHGRQRDLLDDHRIAGERRDDVPGLDVTGVEQPADGFGHRGAVDDCAVDDAVGRDRFDAEGGDAIARACRLQLHGLDSARSDVESYDGSGFAKHERPRG